MKKSGLIVIGIVIAFVIMMVGYFASTNNGAINLEEQIKEASASIEVQEKRRVDLIVNLVDVVQEYSKYESSTLKDVVAARAQATSGNIEEAKLAINAIAEAYPDLKASKQYENLMTELALTENGIAEHRNNYNQQIKSYNKYVRRFPASAILNIMGYEKVEFTYTEYNAPTDAPKDLFK